MVERETGPGQEAVENVVEGDEHGDWLDSFVVEATQGEDPIRSRQNSHYQHSERGGSRLHKRCHYFKSVSDSPLSSKMREHLQTTPYCAR